MVDYLLDRNNIKRISRSKKYNTKRISERNGYSEKHISNIISGKAKGLMSLHIN